MSRCICLPLALALWLAVAGSSAASQPTEAGAGRLPQALMQETDSSVSAAAQTRASAIPGPVPLWTMAPASFPTIATPDPTIQVMIDRVTTDAIVRYTGDLSGEWAVVIGGAAYTLTTRYTDSGVPVAKATQYVSDHLAGLGLKVEQHTWQPDRPPNVIGELAGEGNVSDIFMITAHLDDMPAGGPAPGADDNASGSVAVLVAADILTQYHWGCTLRFALWTGEEQGLLGSSKYVERAAARGEKILGVLNLDMIAWNTAGSAPDIDLHAYSALPATVNLAKQVASVIAAYNINLIPQLILNGTMLGDHASFWSHGYTAILGIEDYYGSSDFNPHYHTAHDQLAYLDLPYYTAFVKAAVAAFAHMSDCLLPTAFYSYLPLLFDSQ